MSLRQIHTLQYVWSISMSDLEIGSRSQSHVFHQDSFHQTPIYQQVKLSKYL